jgi:CxxC motif-containing protein
MAKQVTKSGPITPAEQAFINKRYESNTGEKIKPGTNAEISEGDLKIMRSGREGYATYYMGKKIAEPKKVAAATPVAKKEQPKAEVKKEQPVEKKAIVKAVVEQKPAAKVKAQDTRGYNKEGKQNVVAKTAQKLTGVQSLRRAAELAANKLLTKSGSSLRFKKAIKEPVKKK